MTKFLYPAKPHSPRPSRGVSRGVVETGRTGGGRRRCGRPNLRWGERVGESLIANSGAAPAGMWMTRHHALRRFQSRPQATRPPATGWLTDEYGRADQSEIGDAPGSTKSARPEPSNAAMARRSGAACLARDTHALPRLRLTARHAPRLCREGEDRGQPAPFTKHGPAQRWLGHFLAHGSMPAVIARSVATKQSSAYKKT